ncbi:MAG: exodeoxyribonuclease VII small subunit [Actinomycetota bacterium]|nr:exodeoxyribonuclease VII small subunit [Actinomycetota bacterium]
MTFGGIMRRLEEIASALEKQDLELEEGLKLFEEGVGLVREARRRLTEAGARVEKLIGSLEEELSTEEFRVEENNLTEE